MAFVIDDTDVRMVMEDDRLYLEKNVNYPKPKEDFQRIGGLSLEGAELTYVKHVPNVTSFNAALTEDGSPATYFDFENISSFFDAASNQDDAPLVLNFEKDGMTYHLYHEYGVYVFEVLTPAAWSADGYETDYLAVYSDFECKQVGQNNTYSLVGLQAAGSPQWSNSQWLDANGGVVPNELELLVFPSSFSGIDASAFDGRGAQLVQFLSYNKAEMDEIAVNMLALAENIVPAVNGGAVNEFLGSRPLHGFPCQAFSHSDGALMTSN